MKPRQGGEEEDEGEEERERERIERRYFCSSDEEAGAEVGEVEGERVR